MPIPPDLAQRLATARADRSKRQARINDYLTYADPAQPRIGDSVTTTQDRADEVDALYDGTLMEVHEDFASDLVDRVMPRDRDWVEYEPEETLDEFIAKELEPEFDARKAKVFSAIRQSNFYSEAAGEWAGNLGHGTSAMVIIDYGAGLPLCFESISPSQLLIERGPGGLTSLRAREYSWALEDALAYWPHYDWPRTLRMRAKSTNGKRSMVKITEAATLVPDPAGERWTWRVCADDHLVHTSTLEGRGSCPIIVTRWRTFSASAWGVGPGLKTLPDAMTLNQERRMVLKNLGKWVDPPVAYDDDGVLNPEGGVGPGDWIPRLPGSKVEQLKPEGMIEAAYYEQGTLQDNIRRGLFQYGPRQRGKTPPTFGQWMDEKTEEGRRLELPTGKVYDEGVIAILDRVEHLLTQRGDLDPVITQDSTIVRLRPLSPLARQQAAEDVSQANQILTMARAVFGDQVLSAFVDAGATLQNIKKALNDKLIMIRSADAADPLLRGVLGQPGMGEGLETAPSAGGAA